MSIEYIYKVSIQNAPKVLISAQVKVTKLQFSYKI